MSGSGDMRESVRFDRRTATPDGYGNALTGWAPLYGPVRAKIVPINGREEVLAGKLAGIQPFAITIRYSDAAAQITPECRAVNARTGVTYDITAIQNPDLRHEWLSILVKAGDIET